MLIESRTLRVDYEGLRNIYRFRTVKRIVVYHNSPGRPGLPEYGADRLSAMFLLVESHFVESFGIELVFVEAVFAVEIFVEVCGR